MSKKILFSVILPTYNRSDFLQQSINSVLGQQFPDFELICVDDGSTDNSKGVIKKFQSQDARVKLIVLDKNMGRCTARNKGIETATGEWICFLDSDDIYLDNHLSVLQDLIETYPEFNGFATGQVINETPKKYNTKKYNSNKIVLTFNDFIRSNPIQLNQFCYSKLRTNIKFPDEKIPISEDWYFVRMFALTNFILKTNIFTNNLLDHRERTINLTAPNEFVKWNLYTANLFFKHTNVSERIKNKILSYTNLLAANILLSENQKKESVAYFKNSLHFLNTYFDALFYKALLKYLLSK